MVGTEFFLGQGLGNQLFCYVTARAKALQMGYQFGTAGQNLFAYNIHNDKGMYFMNVDLGNKIVHKDQYKRIYEQETRLFIPTCIHDVINGCMVAGEDKNLENVNDYTLLYGNLQSEKYYLKYKDEIKEWLKVKSEFDTLDFSDEKICIMNMRGGEYTNLRELHLGKGYWINAMKIMNRKVKDLKYIIITDDINSANEMFPNIEAYHFDIGTDYAILKNAYYVIASNSSFAYFPLLTSNTNRFILAPKYWARHNVSDGYWASEQNIYSGWNYMDRMGNLFTSQQCMEELELYKANRYNKLRINKPFNEWEKSYYKKFIQVKECQERVKKKWLN